MPIAREWVLRGDLDDPGLTAAVRDDVVPRMRAHEGFGGALILVDRDRSMLRSLAIWEDERTSAASSVTGTRFVAAVAGLTSARVDGPWTYDVVRSRFDGVEGRPPLPKEVDLMRAHVRVVEGGDVPGTPAPVAPGCVAAVLLRGRDRELGLAVSLWQDEASARRAVGEDGLHHVLACEHLLD